MLSNDEIKKNYKSFDNEKIKRIASKDAKSLREDTLPILIDEIKKRNLGNQLIEWVKAERRKLSKNELDILKNKVKSSACTHCQKQANDLKGYQFTTITGILVDENITDYKVIICEKCGNKNQRNAALWTLFFGWWSVGGFFATLLSPIDFIKNKWNKKENSEFIRPYV